MNTQTNNVLETNTETLVFDKKAVIKKAVIHFRENYKKNKYDLTLGDFMMYAIIKGQDINITIRDSHYEKDKNPLTYHQKFKTEIYNIAELMSTILKAYGEPAITILGKHNNYTINRLHDRYKKFFGLEKDEINFLMNYYVQERETA